MKNETAVVYDALSVSASARDKEVRTFSALCDARIALHGYKTPSRVISNRAALVDYCRELIGGEALESFRVICVDAQCRLLGESEISSGTLSEVAAYPRKIATIALLMNAHSVFLAHNHPGGTCAPSREDIASTMRIKSLLGQMDILVLDHCIVTPDGGSYSMAQHGDL